VLALLAVPMLGQRLSGRALLGIAISYGGALLLIAGATAGPLGQPDALGVTLIFASTLMWALYWILNTRMRSDPLALLATSFAIAAILFSLVLYAQDAWPPLTLELVGYAVWIGALEMGLTFLLWQRALRLTAQVGRIGQLIFLAPFLSLVPIALVLKEAIQPSSLLGLTIIVIGLLVTGQPGRNRARHPPEPRDGPGQHP
jgi:drug/metabolite transporter (DMT)-like permease